MAASSAPAGEPADDVARHFLAGLRARYTREKRWVFTPGNGLTMNRYADEALAAYREHLRALQEAPR